MTIYKQYALDFLKKGYSVIPDKQGTKAPAIQGWNGYSSKMPSLEEVNQWAEIPDTNIAVMLGETSGIIALDLDTDDKNCLDKIGHLLPFSPVERRGSKGWVRFFRYSGENSQEIFEVSIDQEGKQKKHIVLELLSQGKKVTIPPSIHPKGMEYVWIGKSLLDISKIELPLLPSNLMTTIASKLGLQQSTLEVTGKIHSGRNSALGSVCANIIGEKHDLETSLSKLIDEDKKINDKPLFSDIEEFKTKIPLINAGKFYFNYLESINIKREKQNLLPELPISILSKLEKIDSKEIAPIEKEEFLIPEPTGTLKQICDYIKEKSYVEQPIFALSASLALLGTLISRKMIFQCATPNFYILNVGSSGSGKDSCQQALKTLLKAADAGNLIGASSYPSEASIMAFLSTQPTRIDIIDEASSFLKSASSGGAPYQTGIGDLLCELYSCSNDHFLGKVLASDGGKRVGACWRPNLNVLCSTTYRGVSEGISQSTLEKGLFARFLTFFGEDGKKARRIKNQVFVPNELSKILKYWNSWQNPTINGNMPDNFPAYEIGISTEADILLENYFNLLEDIKVSTSNSSITQPIVARLYQQMLKIVLISAVSNATLHNIPRVEIRDVEFGYKLIRYFYSKIKDFVEETLHDNERSKNLNKLLFLIKKAGKKGISNIELVKQSKSIKPQERVEIIKDLFESQLIEKKEKLKDTTIIHIFKYIGE